MNPPQLMYLTKDKKQDFINAIDIIGNGQIDGEPYVKNQKKVH